MQVCSKVFYGKQRILTVQFNLVQATSGLMDTILMETTVLVEHFVWAKQENMRYFSLLIAFFPNKIENINSRYSQKTSLETLSSVLTKTKGQT